MIVHLKLIFVIFVKAGSSVLGPDQYEIEHFLEHIAFKAGNNMNIGKANDLGFKLGEINGGTSFDFTGYYFKGIETKEKRDIAFQLIHDIIWDLDFKDSYIVSERSVLINELVVRGEFHSNSIINGIREFNAGIEIQFLK